MLGIFSRDAMKKKKKSIHLRALMAKMITAMYSLLGKMSLLGLLTGVWITSGSLGMVETKMPIPNVDDNIKPTTLRDLINS